MSAAVVLRYRARDSWRGICASLVVLFHFDARSHACDRVTSWLVRLPARDAARIRGGTPRPAENAP